MLYMSSDFIFVLVMELGHNKAHNSEQMNLL
jgi:hypothetical protein